MQKGTIVGVQGEVMVWELEASHLAQRSLRLPAAVLEAPLSTLAVHDDGSLFLGDKQGTVWRLQVCRDLITLTYKQHLRVCPFLPAMLGAP